MMDSELSGELAIMGKRVYTVFFLLADYGINFSINCFYRFIDFIQITLKVKYNKFVKIRIYIFGELVKV